LHGCSLACVLLFVIFSFPHALVDKQFFFIIKLCVMKSKSMTERNGNGHSHAETLTENPSFDPNYYQKVESYPELSETEVEDVEGVTMLRPGEGDKEVQNKLETESAETETDLEEAGFELPSFENQPMDALFASYTELIPKREAQIKEVIIGADNRVRVFATTAYPWRAICSLKITAKDNSRWIGTGWLVAPRTLMTAGHCVYLHDLGGWAKSIEVIPGLNEAARPFGSFITSNLRSVNGWTNSKNRDYDYGAIILPQNSRPGDRTGYFGFGVKSDAYLMSSVLNLAGYPGDKGGNQQWFMALRPKSLSSRVIKYDIDTIGGQSGAPVWVKVGNIRTCVGIHTNGDLSGNSATRIVTPVFNNIQSWKNQGL
jgi:V8-like Glu-specific endopeptidase